MELLARWLARYAGWIVAAVVGLVVLCGLYSANLSGRLSGAGWTVPGSEEARAERGQDAGFVGRGSASVILAVRDDRFSAPSPEFDQRVAGVTQRVAADPRLQVRDQVGWTSLPPPQRDELLGADRRTTLTTLELGIDDGTAKRVLPQVERELSAFDADGLRVYLVGQAAAFAATNEVGDAALKRVELILLPLVVAILLVLYRGIAAALISLGVAVTAIVVATGALTWLAGVVELNVIVQNIATMLGLGVSVDYSLILIRRFIDEVAGSDRDVALANTMRTAGRTVAASGTTVAVALSTLLIVDMPLIRSIAIAGIIGVALAVLACLVVLPAVLYLLGPRAAAWRLPWLPSTQERSRRRWDTLARTIMARPVAALAITSAALVALAVPAFGLQTDSGDASVLPKSSSVRQGYDLVEGQFGKGAVEPILVVIESDRPFSGADDFARLAAMTTGFGGLKHAARVASPVPVLQAVMPADPLAAISPANFHMLPADSQTAINRFVSMDRKTIAIDVFSNGRAADSDIKALLAQVRAVARSDAATGWHVSVGGLAAVLSSATQQLSDVGPVAIAAMLGVIYVLLVLTFRSLLLPCKAIVLNLLSVGAALGAVALVFQHGVFADVLGVASVGPIQNYLPVLLVAVLFSLSTDYEVFLLSRVRERYEVTGDNTESVVYGLVQTAPLISGAALLMATIFAAFLITPLVTVQQVGFATAVAIAIDATIVRLVMVPAAMRLLGRWNWWLPRGRTAHPGATSAPNSSCTGADPRGRRAPDSLTVTPARSKSVVITGASSGLGRAAAIRLSELGYRVFAGVRSESSAAELSGMPPSRGELIPVTLDVTDTTSIAQAGELIEDRCSDTGVWAVVNNAGVCVSAPLECVPLDALRGQLETNVVGAVAVSQRLLPLLRASGGRIVNVSSGIGNVAPPYLGAYAAAQSAKEGLSDALRRELRPLGVSVSVIQPGAIYTPLWAKIRESANEILATAAADVAGAYRARFVGFLDFNEAQARASKTTPADFADAVAAALAAKRPKSRYRVGVDSRAGALARRAVPDRVMDALIAVGLKALTRAASSRRQRIAASS